MMAFHNLLRRPAAGIFLLLLAGPAGADEKAKPATLTPEEIRDGWVLLFDGETTFGWTTRGEVDVADGHLRLAGGKETAVATTASPLGGGGEVKWSFYQSGDRKATMTWVGHEGGRELSAPDPGDKSFSETIGAHDAGKTAPLTLRVPRGGSLFVRRIAYKPAKMAPLFNGKDLSGWKPYTGDPKREKSVFSVTPAGELAVKNGPGDLQTEGQWADFVLQLECRTNGKGLNSGVFFRCLPGQYQQGYEAQIQNAFRDGDRTKPVDFGTGAIYRRVAARRVVSDDNVWFAMTVLAKGPHVATWVNGYPVVSWTDDRKPADNGRTGRYTKAGPISLQGHDPTTDLLFRNIRLAELK